MHYYTSSLYQAFYNIKVDAKSFHPPKKRNTYVGMLNPRIKFFVSIDYRLMSRD